MGAAIGCVSFITSSVLAVARGSIGPTWLMALTSPHSSRLLRGRSRDPGSRWVYWSLEPNPDEAIAASWCAPKACDANAGMGIAIELRRADRTLHWDNAMWERIAAKGVAGKEESPFCRRGRINPEVGFDAPVRAISPGHSLQSSCRHVFGNHSPCASARTVVEAARVLAGNRRSRSFHWRGY